MNKLSGWLLLDKPYQMSSAALVRKISYWTKKSTKVGHAGTLDPLAEGLLPIALGEATKTCQFITDQDKEYIFTITWGFETTSGDLDGVITKINPKKPSIHEISDIIPVFEGKISQIPSIYSAIKINGVPSYKLARQGVQSEIQPRIVSIFFLKLLNFKANNATFQVKCSKGTYVRSLAQDLARALNTCGTVSFLKRINFGSFTINHAITLAKLDNLLHNDDIKQYLLPIDHGLGDILAIDLPDEQIAKVRNGLTIYSETLTNFENQLVRLRKDNQLQALVTINKGQIKPLRIFNH